MSRMTREISQHMSGLNECGERRAQASFSFPRDFVGFQGHFPTEPILPGVCVIEAVLVLLRSWKSRPIHLSAIRLAKFLAPIGNDEKTVIVCEVTLEDRHYLAAKASVSAVGIQKARLRIEATVEE